MWDKFISLATTQPDALAISGKCRNLTYSQLIHEVIIGASYFQKQNFRNQTIAIALDEKSDEVICALSALISGNAFFFIPHPLSETIFQHVPIALLVTNLSGSLPTTISRISWNELKTNEPEKIDAWWQNADSYLENPFCVYATSGSTGAAKYVVHDYQSILEDTNRQIEENQIHSSDRIDFLFASSFSSSLASIFPAFLTGASLFVFDLQESNLSEIPSFWLTNQITFATLTTSSFRTICRIYQTRLKEFTKCIRFLCLGGEAILESDLELVRKYFPGEITLQLAYASTETRTIASVKLFPGKGDFSIPHDGFPVRHKELRLIDFLDDMPETGEIEIKSNFISKGYWKSLNFLPHPTENGVRIYRTGDLGRWTGDGGIKLVGRNQSRVKLNGLFVDLNQLEEEITFHCDSPAVCKILVLRDAKGMEYLGACIVSDGRNEKVTGKKFWEGKKLSMIPRKWIFLEKFPLNSHGKIDQKALEDLIKKENQELILQSIEEPLTKLVFSIWAEELGNPVFDLTDDFFTDLGGSSFSAEVIMNELSKKLGKNLPVKIIYTSRTIKNLVIYIKNSSYPKYPFLEFKTPPTDSKNLLNLVFLEVGQFDSFEDIIKLLSKESQIQILTLRYDLFQILEGKTAEHQLNELIGLLESQGPMILVGISFNGWLAAKIAERLFCPVILLDVPFYRFGNSAILERSRYAKINYAWGQLMTKGLRKGLDSILSSFLGFIQKKVGLKKLSDSIFEKSVNKFLRESTQVTELTELLYVYSTYSMMTSENDIISWSQVAKDGFSLFELEGDHLDASSPKFASLMVGEILKFTCEIDFIPKTPSTN